MIDCCRIFAGRIAFAGRRAMLCGTTAFCLCALPFVASSSWAQNPDDEQPAEAVAGQDQSAEEADLQAAFAMERVLARAIARAERSVVSIARRTRPAEQIARRDLQIDPFGFIRTQVELPDDPSDPDFIPNEFATGVVLDRGETSGLILTNFHVVDVQCDHFVTTVDRKVFRARIKAADARIDLAVLEIVEDNEYNTHVRGADFTPIELGDADTLQKGHIVIALGNPYAIARDGQPSASWGIVANLSRKAGMPPASMDAADDTRSLHDFGTLIQTDARLNLGTSGGALVNLRGQMVGLTTSQAAIAGFEQSAGFAIPVNAAFRRFIEQLKRGEEVEYGFLGIDPGNLSRDEILRGRHGVLVRSVSPATPAWRADVREQDVITHINGSAIFDADGLRLNVGKLPAAAIATLTIERNGRTQQQQVELAKYPVISRRIVTQRPPAWRGMRVDFLTAVVNPRALTEEWASCVAVSEVSEDSPAWRAGLRTGTLISHVATTAVDRPEDFRREVGSRKGAVQFTLRTAFGESQVVTVEEE